VKSISIRELKPHIFVCYELKIRNDNCKGRIVKKTRISNLKYAATPLALALALISSPSFAQDSTETESDDASKDEIVVTGTLISNPNLKQSTPVISTSADDIQLRQVVNAEQLLREIPGVVPSIGSSVNNGNGGASYADLRGLGTNRNLVLIDGNRITPSNVGGVFDLNNIPVALVSRVDVTTGGAATTYGADAIAGVVNYILKRDFSGVEINATQQLSDKGDGNTFNIDATFGANLEDGRGNVVLNVGYQQSDPVYQGARAVSVNNYDSFSGEIGGSGTAIPARFSLPGAGTRVINPVTGALDAGFTPFNFNPYNIFQTPYERFNLYAAARYEISDAVELYTRGLFSKNSVKTIIAPSGVFNTSVVIPLSNPYLPAPARAQFCAANGITVADCAAAATALTAANPAYRTVTTNLRRRFIETGPRTSTYDTTIFDYQLGARGAITDTINWDIRGSYGQSENVESQTGYVLTSRVREALLATNTTTCLSGNASCVPLNVFGDGNSISEAQRKFVLSPSTTSRGATLAQGRAVISGDAGITVPFATDGITFAVGTEFRKYTASQTPDSLSQIAGELGGAGGAALAISGGYNVYEAIGELNIPLIQDKPGFQNLSLEAGIRYSKYTVDAPTNPKFSATTYKFGANWEPIDGAKIRGTYSRAVRAPNIGELFAPVTTGLTNLATDPCAGAGLVRTAAQIAGTSPLSALQAVCVAQGAPVTQLGLIENPTAGQANSTGGGNPNLRPEVANTFTAGVVLQPFSGFSASLDYYYIKVNKAVSSPTPADVVNACFNSVGVANAACGALFIGRDPVSGGLDGDTATTRGLFQPLSNLGTIKTEGLDLSLNYKNDIGFAKLALAFTGNYTFSNKFKSSPSSINRECIGFYSVNCGSIQPKFQWTQRTTLSFGDDIDISLLWRHIDKVKQEPLDAALDASGPAFVGTIAGFSGTQNFGKIKAADYFDLTTRFGIGDNLKLIFTIENLLDRKPPLVGSTVGSTTFNSGNTYPSSYDAIGRNFAMGVSLKF
jgi:iron complex outermembrane recepter protein